MDIRGAQRADNPGAENRYEILSKYSTDLTELAKQGIEAALVKKD